MAFNVRPSTPTEVVPVAEIVNSGDFVVVGAFAGIAETDAYQGENGLWYTTLNVNGIAHAPSTAAFAVGAVVYATAAGTITGTAGTNKPVGIARRVKTSGAGEVWFRIIENTAVAS